ncbi:hypothetical protein [Cerasicoccus fimbriatus]|uniref:hypothetical protein n=1 Tax=Cerasicoccus fimbriatus TaxID=3014554 RepID=UPI0022B581E5|nr:hypothetical protein [Cerasicoccus sp. TK19100]
MQNSKSLILRLIHCSLLLLCAGALSAEPISFPNAQQWATRGDDIWQLAKNGQLTQLNDANGTPHPVKVIGYADLLVSETPANLEIDAQYYDSFIDANGQKISPDLRNMVDPINGFSASQTGGEFLNFPAPFDHDAEGNPLGLKVANEKATATSATFFNRTGVRFNNTPPGRLMFLYEMASPAAEGTRWYAREFTAPVAGCPWRPTKDILEQPEVYLTKLLVVQLEAWDDPAAQIPAKLQRGSVKIDFDAHAAGLDWQGTMDWIAANVSDELFPANSTYVIQLPGQYLTDPETLGIQASQWTKWGKAVHELTDGRRVWLIGHPDTRIASWRSIGDNLGLLFCRITRPTEFPVEGRGAAASYEEMVQLSGNQVDFRNNWIECPDGAAQFGINITKLDNATILDNIISGVGAGFSTGGNSQLTNTIIARNWLERGYDAVQMYGSWVDVILAYNHFAGASGFPNRQDTSGHLGSNLHTDGFQSQANQNGRRPQRFIVFSNFSQFGRHNWPAAWHEIGGATQNFIIDSDAYVDSHIYWNIFQNLMPAGHRGIKTIGPDKDFALSDPKTRETDYIVNMGIFGNAFLERWDHNNHEHYGYMVEGSGIGGSLFHPFYELINSENAYFRTHVDRQPAQFKQVIDARPDPAAREGWQANAPTIADVYEKPITFSGTWDTHYEADFSQTTYSGDKLLEGFVSPLDYAPKPHWEKSPGGAARLTPKSELAQVAPMPTDLADFLGDPSRKGSFFDEFSATPISAKRQTLDNPWREGSPDDGFVLHVKFGSVGTPGTLREIISESNGGKRYEVALTERDTARYRLYDGEALVSEIETTDTFEDGDHLSMQVLTPYFQLCAEIGYPTMLLTRQYLENGLRKIRYVSSTTAPDANQLKDENTLYVWMNPEDRYRIRELVNGEWQLCISGMDSVHANAFRSFSPQRQDSFHRNLQSNIPGTPENYWRDMYPLTDGQWHTLYIDDENTDSTTEWQEADLRFVYSPNRGPGNIAINLNGKSVGANRYFNGMAMGTGRPRAFLRHNIDHQAKEWDWTWTPNVDLPRGQVTLFDSFDGSYETFRVIRGGQGEYGLPPNTPAYRSLETIGAAISFIRSPLDESGRAPGWGKPDIYLHGE